MAPVRTFALLAVAALSLPIFALALAAPPEALAYVDTARCALPTPALDGFDRCERWAARDAQTTGPEDASGVAVSPVDGTVFVTGVIEDSTDAVETVAHDPATGAARWTTLTAGAGLQWGSYAAVSPDGATLYVAGDRMLPGQPLDYLVLAYDAATGAVRWTAAYDGPGHGVDLVSGIAATATGVVVTGSSRGLANDDVATVAFDGATGATLWEARFDGAAQKDDDALAMTASADGARVYVAGWTVTGPWFPFADALLLAYDASTGALLWSATHAGPNGIAGADAVAASPDGSAVVLACDQNDDGLAYATVAFDARTGEERWAASYHGLSGHVSVPSAVAFSEDSARVFVTGASDGVDASGDEGNDYATVAYDAATGAQQWAQRYDGPAHARDSARALAVAGSHVIVTGLSDTGPTALGSNGPWWDVATISYDAASGQMEWLARYNGPLSQGDDARAIALSPAKDAAYVAGSQQGVVGTDFLTLAYDVA